MGHIDLGRLNRLLGDPELAWVLDRVRRRMERGQSLQRSVTRNTATSAERDAVARLFGRPPRAARGVSVPLDELDALLRRSGIHHGGLGEAVVALTGPVAVLAHITATEAQAWADAFARVESACQDRPALSTWISRVRTSGLAKRLVGGSPETGRELLDGVAAVVAALPVSPGESLSTFAARVCGRAHALDEGSPLGTLALGAARALAGLEPPGPDESAAEARREAWAAVGVLCDELSSTVLTLGLRGDGSATGRVLVCARTANREPQRWCCCAPLPPLAWNCTTTATSTGAASRLGTCCTAACRSSPGSSTARRICARLGTTRMPLH